VYSQFSRLQLRTFAAASTYDDEDSMPENVRDDRTLNIAKNRPNIKNDFLLNELLNREHNMSSLEAFYNGNQSQMNVFHHSILLYKVNQIQREISKRKSMNPDELPERQGPALEDHQLGQQIANRIFKQVCFHINRHIKDLDTQSL
jgi:hypothetical protein